MKQLSKLALALSLPLVAMSASAAPMAEKVKTRPDISKMRYQARNYKSLLGSDKTAKIDQLNKRMAAASKLAGKAADAGLTPDFIIADSDQYEYIDGPDGSVFLCKSEFDTKEIKYEYYTAKEIEGYKFTIYDTNYNVIGEIKDKVKFDTTSDPENPEIRVASLGITPVITKKFFNSDEKYEVMVYFNMNTPNYTVNSRSVAYQLGGEKDEEGNDIPLCTIPGNLSDVLEVNADRWSENFYLTFVNEYNFPIAPDDDSYVGYVNSMGALIETYKKASYGQTMPTKFFEYKFRLNDWPGDQENATPFISRCIDGKPYFITNGYTDGLWTFKEPEDEYSFAEQLWNENTDYFVDIYQPISLEEPNLIQHTEIEVNKSPGDNIFATFYFVGDLAYRNDINFDYCEEEGKANLVITTKDWDGAEMASTANYYLYAPNGSLEATLGENIDGYLGMSDIEGQEPEYMFVIEKGGEYTFEFLNPFNGNVHHSFSQVRPWKDDYEGLYVNADRIADGDTYKYCFELMSLGADDEGNDLMRIAWLNTDGEIESIDEVNMGQNVRMAKVYIDQSVLSPYTFDTTPEREYMIIVKRGDEFSTQIQEYFLIGTAASEKNPVGNILLELTKDKELGNLMQVSTMCMDSNPLLWVMYYNNDTDKYSQLIYNLPFNPFAGGDGTAENPYKVATIGDLQCVRNNLGAHYELVDDIDASNFNFMSIGSSQKPFTGTIKGNGHTITNLTVAGLDSYNAMFENLSQANISGITFVNPTVKISDASYNALIACYVQQSTLSDIHLIGLNADSESATGSFGGIVNQLTLNSSIKDSSVTNASINLPGASTVGGIAADSRTGSTILSSAFSGSINAESIVGGILATSSSNSGSITDCHVDADLNAGHIVGGIIGDMDTRISIDHCYVEGTLTASTTYGTKIVQKGYAVGGIAGNISTYHVNNDSSAEDTPISNPRNVINNCFVNLEAINVPELPEGNQSSVHRIAGFTSINDLTPDWDNIEDYLNIDKFLPTSAENGLKNNYAIASLTKVDNGVEADVNTTEGKDIEASELNEEFFKSLGFKYGATTETPWKDVPENDPSLFHEFGAKFMLDEITAEANHSFDADLIVISRKPLTEESFIDGFSCEISDESVAEMNGNLAINNNVASIGFNALKPGTAEFTANVNGTLSKVKFNIVPESESSIGEIAAANAVNISFNGNLVTAEGAAIAVFSIDGKKVAAGYSTLSLASLADGIYVVTATDAAGNKATRKLLLQ